MGTNNATAKEHRFIERAEELYESDPLEAVKVLTNGVNNLLKSHGLDIPECSDTRNGDVQHPGIPLPNIPQQELDAARRSLDRTARDAAGGTAPDPDEWDMDIGIARATIELAAAVHG